MSFIRVTLVALVALLQGCDSGERWTFINATDQTVFVSGVPSHGLTLLPGARTAFLVLGEPENWPVHMFVAYRIVENPKGNIVVRRNAGEILLVGDAADLIYCKSIPVQILRRENFTVRITVNQPPGTMYELDPNDPSCPG